MAVLHIIRTSAFNDNDLQQCLQVTNESDGLVLIDDGCYNLNHPLLIAFMTEHPSITVNIVQTHANARAITLNETDNELANNIHIIEISELPALLFNYTSSLTWQ